jgi:hypothetical protein
VSDLLERLRGNIGDESRNQEEAADEIERLRGLLREARSIASDPYTAEYALTAMLARIDAALSTNLPEISSGLTVNAVQPSGTD